MNNRQRKVMNRLLDGFEGKLSTSKYAKLAKCSADTALRDVKNLLKRGVSSKTKGEGRSTSIVWRNWKKYLTFFNGCEPRSETPGGSAAFDCFERATVGPIH